jgi:streptothricin acetyltransferase
MNISIEEISTANANDVGKCDGEFAIDSIAVLHFDGDVISYAVSPVPCTSKQYGKDDIDYTTHIADPDKAVFLAYVDEEMAGQIILAKNWNKYARIDDIAVDVKFRRQGIGNRLLSRARRWAQERGMAGIVAETQNNNVGACRFYESAGFELRGFDTHLYKGIVPGTDEIALYWYFLFR